VLGFCGTSGTLPTEGMLPTERHAPDRGARSRQSGTLPTEGYAPDEVLWAFVLFIPLLV